MKTGFIPWPQVVLEDALRLERAACFAVGCVEREHRLNVDALLEYWAGASLAFWALLLPIPSRRPQRAGAFRCQPETRAPGAMVGTAELSASMARPAAAL